jgi:hypothetical protein
MNSDIFDKIKEISEKILVLNPKNYRDLSIFLRAWYCDRYNIPFTSEESSNFEFETLLLEFFLVGRWNTIKDGTLEKEEALKEDEDWLKEKMGDDYHEEVDYFLPPPKDKKDVNAINNDEIEENFDTASLGE